LGRSNKVITMELLGKIRRMHVREKLSERAIAKRTGLSRNTVHKWLKTPEKVQQPKYARGKGFSKLEGFTDELELALKADALRPIFRDGGCVLLADFTRSSEINDWTATPSRLRLGWGSGDDAEADA
jgi:hypothetical protein